MKKIFKLDKQILFLVLTICAMSFLLSKLNAAETISQENKILIESVIQLVKNEYIDETNEDEIIEAAINGMLQSLDPHSIYFSPEKFKELKNDTKGEFGGLGIEVTMEKGLIKVISPIDGTPAQKKGVLGGDLITHINKESILGKNLSEVVTLMRGKPKTNIEITIVRDGIENGFDLLITREIIKIPGILVRVEGDTKDIGYLRVSAFNERTAKKLAKEILNFEISPLNRIESYILDLRRNPGGLLSQAIEVSNLFIDKGQIVSTKRPRFDATISEYRAKKGDLISGKPLLVMVNGGSASASEIVAGALQDNNRAIIVGTKTFGKGSVQTLFPIKKNKLFFPSDDKLGAVKLTTAEYFTPSGKSIQAKGIQPDIRIEQEIDNDIDLDSFLVGETQLNKYIENKESQSKLKSGSSAYIPKDKNKDVQLTQAIDILSGLNREITKRRKLK